MKHAIYFLWMALIVSCTGFAVAQTGAASNLNGNWIRKAADNTPDIPIAIVQSGTGITLTIMGNQMTGSLQGGKVTVNGIPETGTVEQNGNSIRWSDGVWVRNGSAGSAPTTSTPTNTPPTNTPPTSTPTLPDFNGNWVGYYADGSKSPYIWAISQSGTSLSCTDVGAGSKVKFTARVEGNQVVYNNKTATLSDDGQKLSWSDQVVWVREGTPTTPTPPTPPVSVSIVSDPATPTPPANTPVENNPNTNPTPNTSPQSSPTLEGQCAQMIQGKVAWNKAGTKQWDINNIRNLCQGTTNPEATISCFTAEINTHNSWQRAIQNCKAKTSNAITSLDLNGKWTGYYGNGSVARNPGTILQNGAIAMIDNGEGSVSPGQIQGNTISAKGWNLTGTISADGKIIRWSNNTTWVKQ